MAGIHEYMTNHHLLCDDIFVHARRAAMDGDWLVTEQGCKAFLHQINRHIDVEENLLFPAFEAKTGTMGGPTHVMRMEHAQLRNLFDEMLTAIDGKQAESYLLTADLVAALLNEHNQKEENILYPMIDEMLGPEAIKILTQVKNILD